MLFRSNVLYYGLAHGLSFYNYLDFENLGIVHSGQLGDVVISTFYSTLNKDKQFEFGDGAYCKQLLSRIKDFSFKENYANEEIFKMYIRGFYGANQGLLGIMKHTETYSPFYDIDFMEFCLSIPVELRYRHRLYKKWIQTKYPEAAKYIWEKEKVRVDYKYWLKIKGKQIPLSQLCIKLLAKIGFEKHSINTKYNMNPLEFWYRTNPQLKNFMDNYFKEHIVLLNSFYPMKSDCENLYSEGNGSEKVQALSLLCFVSLINYNYDLK